MALMVSNISPAQPMKMDTFERLLAGKCKRSEENVGGGGGVVAMCCPLFFSPLRLLLRNQPLVRKLTAVHMLG